MARLEITTPSDKRVYEIVDDFVTIGREVGNHLRLNDPAVAPVHLRLIHGQGGYRLEPADAGLEVEVNGEPCRAHPLAPEDRIRIGGTTLRFVDERATPAPVRRPPRAAPHHAQRAPLDARRHAAHHHHVARPARALKGWVLWVPLGAVAFVVLLVLLRLLGAGSYYREQSTPEHWLAVAESQLAERAFARALDSCRVAEMGKPRPETAEQILALCKRIEQEMLRDADQATLDLARHSLEAMRQLEAKFPSATRPRPVARELARSAKLWLERYQEVVSRYSDRVRDVQEVQDLFSRSAPEAQLERPDDHTDVIFAMEQRLVLLRPLYREALSLADGYLAGHPNDAGYGDVRAKREAVVATARADFERREASARRLLAAGRFADARKELQAMRDAIVVNSWGGRADAVEKEIQAAEK